MKRRFRRLLAAVMAAGLVLSGLGNTPVAEAAKKPKLNKKKVTIKVGKKVKLKVKNRKGKVKWSSTNKRVASVNQSGVVKGKKKGKASIVARTGGRKLVCKVTVKAKNTNSSSPTPFGSSLPSISPQASVSPSASAGPSSSVKPTSSAKPSSQPNTSSQPGTSNQPDTSSQPSTSNQPDTSSQPVPSSQPNPTAAPVNTPGSGDQDYNTTEYFITLDLDGGQLVMQEGNGWAFDSSGLWNFNGMGADVVSVPSPTRSGFVFDKWVMIDDYEQPIEGSERTKIDFQVGATLKDATEVVYRAVWTEHGTQPGIDYDKDVLTVGGAQVALGMSDSELREVNGAPSREAKAPQGTDVYVYNNSKGLYQDYFIVYMKDGVVVGMATMSSSFSYKYTTSSSVSYGDSSVPNDFNKQGGYDYNEQYTYNGGDAFVMVYQSKAGRTIHAIQVFAKSLSTNLDDLIKVEQIMSKQGYNADVNAEMAKELQEFTLSFRAGQDIQSQNDDVYSTATSAQDACDELADAGGTGGNTEGSLIDKYGDQYYGQISDIKQVSGDRSPDAFGFITWWLDSAFDKSDEAREKLLTSQDPDRNDPIYVSGGFAMSSDRSYAVVHIVHY